jgi:two-component system, sensor histidine kinase and response regulator
MSLDSRTILVVATLAAICVSPLSLISWRRHRHPGSGRWTIGNLLAALAMTLYFLRGYIPDIWSVALSNGLGLLAVLCFYEGIRDFRGLKPRVWQVWALSAISLALIVGFEYLRPGLNVRIVIFSTHMAILGVLCTRTLLGDAPAPATVGMKFTAAVFACWSAANLVRGIVTLFQPPAANMFALSPVSTAFLMLSTPAVICFTFGFLLMANDRLVAGLKNAEQTTALANKKLESAIESASEMALHAASADAAKTRFLADVSHEIRTPLNAVIGLTDMLLETKLDETQREYVATVRDSGAALLTIINDLLDISKIEAGRIELDEAPFDLREVVENTAELLAWKAQEKGLELCCRIAPDVPRGLRGDAGRLRQILTNLGSNAVKFTAQGQVFIDVALNDVALNGDANSELNGPVVLRFSVTDTGVGIAAHKTEQLFRRYSRVQGSSNRHFDGTGLGLFISKQLAAAMGGTIGVRSEEGKGSSFWFTAEFEKTSAVTADRRAAGRRVLVVNGCKNCRRILGEMLEALGCSHREVANIAEAERAKAAESFDAILVDTGGLPTWQNFTAQIRNERVILLTPIRSRHAESSGISISKPARERTLLEAIVESAKNDVRIEPQSVGRNGVKVLVVDDDAMNRKLAANLLEKLGCEVELAANGLSALDLMSHHSFDVVFMDCQMPEMDGFETARAVRRPGGAALDRSVRIVAMTGHTLAEDRDKCMAAGMDDHVSKPVSLQELADALERKRRVGAG